MYVKTTFMFKEDKGRRGRRKKNFGDVAARCLFCNLSNNLFGRKLIHGSFIKVPSSKVPRQCLGFPKK